MRPRITKVNGLPLAAMILLLVLTATTGRAQAAAGDTGAVHITTDPPGAIVSLKGRGYQMSPATFSNLPVGNYHVQVKLTGFDPKEIEVEVLPGEPVRANVVLSTEDQRRTQARHALATIEVDGKVVSEFKTINQALQVAPKGARIVLDPGDYLESVSIDKHVEIVGKGKRRDIVIESSGPPCLVMATDRASVKGVTLRYTGEDGAWTPAIDIPRGQLLLENCVVESDATPCVAIHGRTAKPTLRKCVFTSKRACGVLFFDRAGGTVERCRVVQNRRAGIEICQGADPVIRKCKVEDNEQAGILVHDAGKGVIEDTQVSFNRFAGIEVRDGAEPVVRHSIFQEGNGGGIYVHAGGRGLFENCEVVGNTLSGVEIGSGSNPLFRECEIHHGDRNGILVSEGGRGEFEDCVVEFNHFAGVETRDGGNPTLRHCVIRNGFGAGVLAHAGGMGIFEDCDIFFNGLSNVEIREEANVIIRKSKIHHGMQAGVLVHEKGKALIEDTVINSNLSNGIETRTGGDPVVRRCNVNRNHYSGVRAHAGGRGALEFCDLKQNLSGPLLMKSGGLVKRHEVVY